MTDPTTDTVRGYFGDPEQEQYDDPSNAAFYAIEHAGVPLTLDMIADRPETDGHTRDELREGLEKWDPDTVDYGEETAYHLGRDTEITIHITREMYEDLHDKGCYIGEDPQGVNVHLSEDYRTIRQGSADSDDLDAWGPVFGARDPSEVDGTETVADGKSKSVMLEAEHGDTVEITDVHTGCRRVPEQMEVIDRTNTYYGPWIGLKAKRGFEGQELGWRLTCPDAQSHLVLWKTVTDSDDYIQTRVRYSTVSAKIRNVSGYDICGGCGEPIKDPMHRSMAMLGQCRGGVDDG